MKKLANIRNRYYTFFAPRGVRKCQQQRSKIKNSILSELGFKDGLIVTGLIENLASKRHVVGKYFFQLKIKLINEANFKHIIKIR